MAKQPQPKPPKVEAVDPHAVPAQFVDYLFVSGKFAGVLHLTLGALHHSIEEGAASQAVVTTRLRMGVEFAAALRDTLTLILDGSEKQSPSPPSKGSNLN